MVVLDTCALIAICQFESPLSESTFKKIDEGAYLLSISFAEIACKIKLGKLVMDLPLETLIYKVSQVRNIEIIDIGVSEWLDSINLDWKENKDPADRLIVAFAKRLRLPIVTSDEKMKKFYRKIIW